MNEANRKIRDWCIPIRLWSRAKPMCSTQVKTIWPAGFWELEKATLADGPSVARGSIWNYTMNVKAVNEGAADVGENMLQKTRT